MRRYLKPKLIAGAVMASSGRRVCQIAHGAGDPLERFRIETVPTLVVVENKAVMARLERPQGCREIEGFLAPWLN